jgi:hypothetical protein
MSSNLSESIKNYLKNHNIVAKMGTKNKDRSTLPSTIEDNTVVPESIYAISGVSTMSDLSCTSDIADIQSTSTLNTVLYAKDIIDKIQAWDNQYINKCINEFNKCIVNDNVITKKLNIYIILIAVPIPWQMYSFTKTGIEKKLSEKGFKKVLVDTYKLKDNYCNFRITFSLI